MLFRESKNLKIINKCFIRYVKCINILKKYKRNTVKVGDELVVVNFKKKVNKFKILRAYISQVAFFTYKKSGYFYKSDKTQIFLLQNPEKLFGKKLLHAVGSDIKKSKVIRQFSDKFKFL